MLRLITLLLLCIALLLTACRAQPNQTSQVDLVTPQTSEDNVGGGNTDAVSTTEISSPLEATPELESPTSQTQVEQTYKALVLVQATAELLSETAKRVQSGELEGFESFGSLIAIGAIASGIDESLPQITPPDYLASDVRAAISLNDDIQALLSRWFDSEIDSTVVLEEIDPLLIEIDSLLTEAEEKLARESDLDAETLERTRQEAMESISEVFETTPDTSLSATTEPQATPEGSEIALNYVGEQERGEVVIQIGRVLVGDKAYVQFSTGSPFKADIFDDKEILAELIFVVTNNSDRPVTINLYNGSVQVNSEQIDLFDYLLANTTFGDNLSGEIYPGVTKIGGLWFGIDRSTLDDISTMTFRTDGPVDAEDFSSMGEDYLISIDLSNRIFEAMPEELR